MMTGFSRIDSMDIGSLYPYQLSVLNGISGMNTSKLNIRQGYKGEWIVELPSRNENEIIEWCRATFGNPGRDRKYAWRATWAEFGVYKSAMFVQKPRIFLRNESDVALFKLRWS